MKKYTILLLVCIWLIIPLHSEIVAPTEGHTQVFNVLGQGFFEGYYPITATCQKIGDTYYLFTEDVRVNDISISPTDSSQLLVSTSSGVYRSYDAGATWEFASGTGNDMLDPDGNNGSAENPIVHRAPIDGAFCLKEGEWWVGFDKGPYQTKDDGESWKIKTRGLPSYTDPATLLSVYPPFTKMMHDDQVTDYDSNKEFWACSQAGLYYWDGRQFVDMGIGLPQTLSDWEHLSVFDFIDRDSLIYIASELGLYTGIVNMDDEMVSWMPIGGADITVTSSSYDTVTSMINLVVSGVEMNTYVNVIDAENSLYWRGRVQKSGDDLIVAVNADELYYSDETVLDPDTLDYSTYDISAASVYQPSNVSISRLYLADDGTLYYVAGTEIYKMDTDQSSDLVYDVGAEINDMVCHSSTMYVATVNGLFSADMADLTSWTKETGILLEGSTSSDTTEYDVRSIEFDSDGNMYVGCHMGGIIRREAATGTWTNLNIGLGHRAVLPEKTNNLTKAFDSLQVHTTLEPWFGDLPDIDGDERQYCLVADLDDYYFLDAGDDATFIDGFFNPVDQLSKDENSNSNEMDVIYIDSDPLDLDSADAWSAVVNALTVEILQTKPVQELEWVYRGLAELGEFIVGLKDTSTVFNPGVNNSLTTLADVTPTVKDYDYCFSFFYYLYSHYFTDEAKMLTYVNEEETGIEGISSALLNLNGSAINDVFTDFIAAIFFDELSYTDIPIKYTFPDLHVIPSVSTLKWGYGDTSYVPSPVLRKQTPWSYYVFQTNGFQKGYDKSPFFTRTTVFNGEDEATFDFKSVLRNSEDWGGDNLIFDEYEDNTFVLDSKNVGMQDVSNLFGASDSPYQELYFIVTTHETPNESGTAFTIFDRSYSADEFSIGFNHNAGAPDYLNIFCFTDEQMYDDAGKALLYDSDGNGSADLEGPTGTLVVDGDTTALRLSQFYADAGNDDFVYSAIMDIGNVDVSGSNISIDLKAENINAKESSASATGALAKIDGLQDQKLLVGKENASIMFRKGAVKSPRTLAVFSTPSGNLAKQVMSEYELGAALSEILYISEDIDLAEPVKITMRLRDYPMQSAEMVPVLFRAGEGKLIAVARLDNAENGQVSFETDEMGSFQVILAKEQVLKETVKLVPDKFALKRNYPNPFNSSTSIRYQVPQAARIQIMIYDLMGRHVRTLYHGEQSAGYYTINWNGRSDDNRLLPSGVYFYRMVSGDFQATEKMIYLK